METLCVVLMACVLVGCPGGSPALDGGGGGSGGSGGGAGGGSAVPANLLPGDCEAFGRAVLIAPGGAVLVVGDVERPDSGTSIDLMVAKFSPALVRDSTFGTSGSIAVPFTLPLFDQPFDAHRHLTISGNTAFVTDVNLVKVSTTLTRRRLGLFTTALP